MPFGIFNACSTFIRLINEVLRPFIGKLVVVYFDDILLDSHNEASLVEHLSQVLQVLRQQTLYARLKKCELFTPQVIFLSYIVSRVCVQVDESEVEAIKSWPMPIIITKV